MTGSHINRYNGVSGVPSNICPDGHECQNGSVCKEIALMEGKYFCDCYAAIHDTTLNTPYAFAGLSCQHKATQYCTTDTTNLQQRWIHFCTNEGTCLNGGSGQSLVHEGCNCPSGYVGERCEFIAGSKPSDALRYTKNANVPTKNPRGFKIESGLVTCIILLMVGVIGALVVWFLQLQRKREKGSCPLSPTRRSRAEERPSTVLSPGVFADDVDRLAVANSISNEFSQRGGDSLPGGSSSSRYRYTNPSPLFNESETSRYLASHSGRDAHPSMVL